MSNSVDPQEIQQFSKDSDRWWDENGPFAPLHRLNPVRLRYLKEQICSHYDLDRQSFTPFKKLKILDIGCGGGLVCEPLARLGASVTGIDADHNAIEVAQDHATLSDLKINYQNTTAEDFPTMSSRAKSRDLKSVNRQRSLHSLPLGRDDDMGFDIVLALEIVEHVNDVAGFVKSVSKLVKPGGLVIFSTLNRTPKSFALGIVAAEYILRWVPKGTHSWKKFIRPSELARHARKAGLRPNNITGLIYNPVTSGFELSDHDIDVNYFLTACRV